MNIGVYACGILVIPFVLVGLLFALLKEKAAVLVSGFYVPADFDTIEKAFSGVETAEKGIKQGLSRSNADFGSPCSLYSIMDFCCFQVRLHRGV